MSLAAAAKWVKRRSKSILKTFDGLCLNKKDLKHSLSVGYVALLMSIVEGRR